MSNGFITVSPGAKDFGDPAFWPFEVVENLDTVDGGAVLTLHALDGRQLVLRAVDPASDPTWAFCWPTGAWVDSEAIQAVQETGFCSIKLGAAQ